jgi:hypothetical protein
MGKIDAKDITTDLFYFLSYMNEDAAKASTLEGAKLIRGAHDDNGFLLKTSTGEIFRIDIKKMG